jgi:hypothetical protein
MTLEFPNRMRILNAAAKTIAFSGYDGITEIRFSLPFSSLDAANGVPLATSAAYLAAFDAARGRIQNAAASVHARTNKTFHSLDAARF